MTKTTHLWRVYRMEGNPDWWLEVGETRVGGPYPDSGAALIAAFEFAMGMQRQVADVLATRSEEQRNEVDTKPP